MIAPMTVTMRPTSSVADHGASAVNAASAIAMAPSSTISPVSNTTPPTTRLAMPVFASLTDCEISARARCISPRISSLTSLASVDRSPVAD